MDLQTVVNVVGAAALAAAGWFARVLWEANKELRDNLSKLREEIPKTYVTKVDFRDSWGQVMELLREINNKLDRKADK